MTASRLSTYAQVAARVMVNLGSIGGSALNIGAISCAYSSIARSMYDCMRRRFRSMSKSQYAMSSTCLTSNGSTGPKCDLMASKWI